MSTNSKTFKNYSLLVNSTDNFDDCWDPFFTLFKKYWHNFNGNLYLNTETKSFQYPELEIRLILNNTKNFKQGITWSECLIRALHLIDDDIILYMQDDYFLKAPVDNEVVNKYVQLMRNNESVHCIQLTDQAVISSTKSEFEGLYNVKVKQRYRISCQAALWRKDILLHYLRKNEKAWQFEERGSIRASITNHNFFIVDPQWVKINHYEIIPYIFTGIIQGRWNKQVVELFSQNSIKANLLKRGFYIREKDIKSNLKKNIYPIRRMAFYYYFKVESYILSFFQSRSQKQY